MRESTQSTGLVGVVHAGRRVDARLGAGIERRRSHARDGRRHASQHRRAQVGRAAGVGHRAGRLDRHAARRGGGDAALGDGAAGGPAEVRRPLRERLLPGRLWREQPGGRMTCFQLANPSGLFSKYRLGNECEFWSETHFDIVTYVGEDGSVASVHFMPTVFIPNTNIGYSPTSTVISPLAFTTSTGATLSFPNLYVDIKGI